MARGDKLEKNRRKPRQTTVVELSFTCTLPLLPSIFQQKVLQTLEAVFVHVLGSDDDHQEHHQETSLEEGKWETAHIGYFIVP